MVIEAWINGEVMTREEFPDEYLADLDGASWQQNIEARAQIISMHVDAFKGKMEKVFKDTHQVTYCLVFKSKANGTDIPEC